MGHCLLVVDDDAIHLAATRCLLEDHGYRVLTALSGNEAVELVKSHSDEIALVILDYRMEGKDGALTAGEIRRFAPELFILIYSGDPSRKAVTSSWKAGAVDFIEKGGNIDHFLKTISNWCQKFEQTVQTLPSPKKLTDHEKKIAELGMVGRSKEMADLAKKALVYKKSSENILILGETGTGKELVARALHEGSKESFFAINCASYKGNTELLESELFGYEKGAFTGAQKDKQGILEVANGGTVFFDEIHQLSLAAQAKLLRVVQEKHIRRVGGTKEYQVEFRLIAAAKPDLEQRVESEEFLADLYHRLNVLALEIPPLRNRKEDIEPLVSHFCHRFAESKDEKKCFLMRTVRYLEKHDWPGNVRELENTVYRLLTTCEGAKVLPENLDAKFFERHQEIGTYEELKSRQHDEERTYIQGTLETSRSKLHAAQKLGLSPSTLHSVMKRLGMYKGEEVGAS